MSVWIEIRCEGRREEQSYAEGARCWSHDNQGPMGEGVETLTAIADLMRDLSKEGERKGWRRTAAGWYCPSCAKRPREKA